ncbi:MAG: ISAs1 family transposase, partial [Desulfovibrionaceae bacterium]
MKHNSPVCLISVLQNVDEHRIERTRKHDLVDILFVSFCAAMCGMKCWEDIETFAEDRLTWFRKFVPLKNGVPSHDTLRRVFERIDTKQLQAALTEWTQSFLENTEGKVIAIDGKTLRRSFDKSSGKKALHMVSAWVTDNNLSLAQTIVDSKHNEITAIPKLLELLSIKGS